jgi:hypothetical protein
LGRWEPIFSCFADNCGLTFTDLIAIKILVKQKLILFIE